MQSVVHHSPALDLHLHLHLYLLSKLTAASMRHRDRDQWQVLADQISMSGLNYDNVLGDAKVHIDSRRGCRLGGEAHR